MGEQNQLARNMRRVGFLMLAAGVGGVCAAVASLMHPGTVAVAVILRDSPTDVSMLVTIAIAVSLVICAIQLAFGLAAILGKSSKVAAIICLCMGLFLVCDGSLDMVYGQIGDGAIKVIEAAVFICYWAVRRRYQPPDGKTPEGREISNTPK